jgi:hypothetical protein
LSTSRADLHTEVRRLHEVRMRNLQLNHELHVKGRQCAELEAQLDLLRGSNAQNNKNNTNAQNNKNKNCDLVSSVSQQLQETASLDENDKDSSLSLVVLQSSDDKKEEEEEEGLYNTVANNNISSQKEGETHTGDVGQLVEQMSCNYNKFRRVPPLIFVNIYFLYRYR